jgi:hypothetical protein
VNRVTLNVVLGGLLLCTAGRVVYVQWVPGPLDRAGILRASDFQMFYLAGSMIAHGESERLYDHPHMQELQRSLAPIDNERNPPGFLFYPPIAPLLISPLARLPYQPAVLLWWLTQAVCFLAAGWLLRTELTVDAAWRPTAWLALLAFYPLWDTVLHGQLAAVLLLLLVAGFRLQRQRHAVWCGLVLSLLAMKPQFFVGAFLWLLLRRDWRSLAAMAGGLALQLAAVAAILGPSVLAAYIGDWPVCAKISLIFQLAPWAEHGLGITVQNVLVSFGYSLTGSHRVGMLLQLLVAGGAALLLFQTISAGRTLRAARYGLARQPSLGPAGSRPDTSSGTHATPPPPSPQEQTCAVLFMLVLTPHVLLYDMLLLAVPLVNLWSSAYWRLGVALYVVTSVLGIPVYNRIGFSIVPAVLLITLFQLSRSDGEVCCAECDQMT